MSAEPLTRAERLRFPLRRPATWEDVACYEASVRDLEDRIGPCSCLPDFYERNRADPCCVHHHVWPDAPWPETT